MAVMPPNFSVPPPNFWPTPNPAVPFTTWERQFENKMTTLISSVTDKLLGTISSLSDRINQISSLTTRPTQPTNPIPPLMRVKVTPSNNIHPPRDDLSGPAKARPYQPRQTNSNHMRSNTARFPGRGKGRGSDLGTRVNQPTQQPLIRQRPAEARDPPVTHSSNADIPTIIKNVHKLTSIGHHKSNWVEIPPNIKKNIDNFTYNIKPPLVDDNFTTNMKKLGEQFAEGVVHLVNDHLDAKQIDIEKTLLTLNPTDKRIVPDIVKQQFIKKQGKKFNENKINSLIKQAVSLVGFEYQARDTVDETTGVNSFNRFQSLVLEDEEDADEGASETFQDAVSQPSNTVPPSTPLGPTASSSDQPQPHCPSYDEGKSSDNPSLPSPRPSTSAKHAPTPTSPSHPHTKGTYPQISVSPSPHQSTDMGSATITHKNHHPKTFYGPTLRSGKVGIQSSSPNLSNELRKKNIFIHPSNSRPSPAELSKIPQAGAEVLLIGDSNLQFVREIPDKWQVLSISGLKLESAAAILQGIPEPSQDDPLKHVILAVGLNDRRTTKPPLTDCVRAAAGTKYQRRRVSFLEVTDPGCARTKDPAATNNIQRLNQAARSLPDVHFIPAPDSPTFHGIGFHFDPPYTNKIIKSIAGNVHSLN